MADFPSTDKLIGVVQSFEGTDISRAAKWFPIAQTLGNVYSFDVLTGNRTKAKYRAPEAPAGTQALTRKVRKEVVLPTLREKKMLSESTLRWLDGAGLKYPEKAMVAIAREFADLDGIIERTHEYARWQLLTAGSITLNGDYSETLNFGIGSEAQVTNSWTDAANADPINDLLAWKKMVEQKSGRRATTLLIGSDQIKSIFQSTKAQVLLGEGTKDRYAATGTVNELAGMSVEVVDDGYENDSGAFRYYMANPDRDTAADIGSVQDLVIIKTEGSVGVTAEGSPVDSKAPDGMIGKFAKSWEQEDPTGRFILEAHTALPGITMPNRFGAFKTLDAGDDGEA